MFKNKKSKLMLALASVSLLAAACGNDDDTNDNNASGDAVTEITEDVEIDFMCIAQPWVKRRCISTI